VENEKPWKTTTGAVVTIVAFVVTLLVLLRVFGPEILGELPALLALGVPLALAWVLAAGAGKHLMPLRRSLALATACLLVAVPLVYWQWEGAEEGEEEGPPEAEEVLFKYEASFTYLSPGENEPLVGYSVLFPCPTVNGEPAITKENLCWQLWGPIDKQLELEVDNNDVIQFIGQRENQPYPWVDIWDLEHSYGLPGEPHHKPWLGYLVEYSVTWKILIQNAFDNLYPGEKLKSIGYFTLPAERAKRVTLEEDNEIVRQENGKVLAHHTIGHKWVYFIDPRDNLPTWEMRPENLRIDFSYQVKLLKSVDNNFIVVKNYGRVKNNTPNAEWLELYPS
jgi:hypothetical protein